MSELIGQSLGRYRILEQLGEGGMATVYKAYDTRLERDVAIKVIRRKAFPEDQLERILKRFEREAKALARLSHPNIISVIDYGEHEGSPYLVMVYMPGGTLKQRLGKPMPWEEAVRILLPIAGALEYAHEHKIIHRDIKPSNILLTEKGQPMLTDFGIAKILETEETATLTGTGMGVGTPEYMAPEQWTGQSTAQSDIYSLGVVLYEMLTGRKPYVADTPAAILLKQANEPLPRPGSFVRDLPREVENLLLKALAKNPRDRYQSMGEMEKALRGLLEGKAGSRGRSEGKRKEAPAPKEKVLLALPAIPRRVVITGGLIVLGIVLIVVIAPALESLPATLFSTQTPSYTSTPHFTPSPMALPEEITDEKGVVMRLVPAGEFTMGSNEGDSDEQPVHTVFLNSYYMDKYEVTNALYKACVDEDICTQPPNITSYSRSRYYGGSAYVDYPVIYVDWSQANTYCEWRGARLPTEAEWEKAARGTDGRTYPWGEGIDCSRANYCEGDTTEVGSYESGVSPYGIYDMAGNVWEWVADWYDSGYYNNTPSSNPTGPSSGDYRVLRGGSWGDNESYLRAFYRLMNVPVNFSGNFGFRCSRSQ